MARITAGKAKRAEYGYVIRNLRPYDREEIERYGHTPKSLLTCFEKPQPWNVGRIDGKPVCVYGHSLHGYCVYFEFLGTDTVNRFMIPFTRMARQYIASVCDLHFDLRHMVAVWEGHQQSRAWLRLLGFHDTGNSLWRGDNRFCLVERR